MAPAEAVAVPAEADLEVPAEADSEADTDPVDFIMEPECTWVAGTVGHAMWVAAAV